MSKRTQGKSAGASTVRVTLVRSPIGFNRTQAATVLGLGLRRIRQSVEVIDSPATRGMIHKVRHLVTVGQS
ncbi:MAG: 50S ribosomal protein L30 [Vicinamibacterales bacterium]